MGIRKILISLLLVAALLLISLIILRHNNRRIIKFTITNVEPIRNVETKTFNETIKTAKVFSEKFANRYFALLDSNVVKDHQDKFVLGNSEKLSAKVILSSTRESFINFYFSKSNDISFKLTPFPAQLEVISRGLISTSPWTLDNILKVFDNEPGDIGFYNSENIFINDYSYSGRIKKIFGISGRRNIIILQNLKIKIGNKSETFYSDTLKYISLLNSDTNFNWAIDSAEGFAEYLFTTEYANLYTTSKFFREAQKYYSLEKEAKEILEIQSRLEKNVDLDYPFEKFNKKKQAFEKKAVELTKDPKFSDRILEYPPFKPKDHYFIVYHPTYESFAWFWLFVNFLFYIFIIIFVLSHKYFKDYLTKISKYLPNLTMSGLLVFLNYEIYANRPSYFPFNYLMLGSTFFLLNFYFIWYTGLDSKNKNNS